ncbi:sulfotransferase [Luminiphilus syltensis NOR5-1B]|uniref:Sulfotransferase n=1 Tax=Luminiphilus syltensis NOR5-1B TaxID=565045 RepID=B8KVD6_9GAMM|nr:sulfotransferase [Luminiphilus syltensis]EED36203.1 sulfotransferase [Luminiphilus syltensis NOR5-1B]
MNATLKQGFTLLESKRYEKAHDIAINAIKTDARDPAPYLLLARIAADHGNHEKAEELFTRAIELDNAPIFRVGFAQYLVTRGDHQQAVALVEGIAAERVDDSHTADSAGVILSRLGLHAAAIHFFRRAIALNPIPANYHYNLGASLQFSGEFDLADAAYRACIEREPGAFRAYTALVSLRKQTTDDNGLAVLEPLFHKEASADGQLQIGHAIAKTHEDLGNYDASLDWLNRAKAAKRESLSDHNNDLDLFAAARATYTAAPAAHSPASTTPPIFIVGLPRTGTTLVDRILGSHSHVVSAGELNTFAGLIKEAAGTGSHRVLDTETLQAATAVDLESVAPEYLKRVAHLVGDSPRFTDKMPLNFFYAGLILKAFPDARIVALRRHPMDSCLSNYRQLFSTGFSYYNYSLSLEDTANYYRAFDQLMAHWRAVLPRERFSEFAYESFVFEQEATTHRLLEFCNLPWEDACLDFQNNAAPVSTASSVQVRQPLYQTSVGRWTRYGKPLQPLQEELKDLIAAYKAP